MKFSDIFRDNNSINEKNVVGFISFVIMVMFALADIISGLLGWSFEVNNFIFNSFLIVTLGSFGISEISKVVHSYKHPTPNEPDERDRSDNAYSEDEQNINIKYYT